MITRTELQTYLDQFLEVNEYKDYCPNGLQVEGREEIKQLASAVTASSAVIKKAINAKADALLVHHGYFWKGEAPTIVGMRKQRIQLLLSNDINLFAYHLPLDGHLTLGNNAEIARLLELDIAGRLPCGNEPSLLFYGLFAKEIAAASLKSHLDKIFERESLWIEGSNKPIHKIAWCSGAAQDYIEAAAIAGCDAYISGEVSERTYHQAKELGIHYFSCGHHATERFGIQALGQHVANQFGMTCEFIDEPNPI